MAFFISESVQLSHQVGEGDRPFIFRKVAIPTPFRTFYQFRNYFRLVHRGYVPLYWKVSNGFKYSIKFFLLSFMFPAYKLHEANIKKEFMQELQVNKENCFQY